MQTHPWSCASDLALQKVSHTVLCLQSWSIPDLRSNRALGIWLRSSSEWRAEVTSYPATCSSHPAANPFQEIISCVSQSGLQKVRLGPGYTAVKLIGTTFTLSLWAQTDAAGGSWQLYCCSNCSLQRPGDTHLWQMMLHWKTRSWESHCSCSEYQPRAALLQVLPAAPEEAPQQLLEELGEGKRCPASCPVPWCSCAKRATALNNNLPPASLRLRKTSRIRAKSLWQSTACVAAHELRWHLPSVRTKPTGSPQVLLS